MKEIIKMLVVLTLICAVCGILLAFVRSGTKDQIVEQILLNVQGPAVKDVLEGSTNDLIKDRKTIKVGDKEYVVFIGKKDGAPWAFAFEVFSGGFGGDIGVIVGFSLEEEALAGVGITTHKETPGLGSRVSEKEFRDLFKGKALTETFKVKADGGVIDAISGATVSSKAVCQAVTDSLGLQEKIREQITE
jgi:electron transport complex protein RnfG